MEKDQLDVWVIDPDQDDRDTIDIIWKEMGFTNDLVYLKNAEETIAKLASVEVAPFIILCEVMLPGMDGFQLREHLISSNSKKFNSVPFIFWSGHASEQQVKRAYELRSHGFFIKDSNLNELKQTFSYILHYWSKSRTPSKVA